jgi:DNA-binding transcriptional regulator YdaS (Cro superfamily)
MAALARRTGLSFMTIDRAKKGFPVHAETARLISQATRGQVLVREILQVRIGAAA